MKREDPLMEPMLPTCHPDRRAAAGYSLLEVLITVAIIGFFVGTAYFGLLKLNSYAASNRLYTCSTQMVQEVIDQALSVRPYYPTVQTTASGDPFATTRNGGSVPTALMVTGTLGTPKVTTIPIFINNDVMAAGTNSTLKTAAQLLSAATVVQGTLTTTAYEALVTTGGTTATPATTGTSYLRWVNVSLSYQFCGQTFNIQRSCLRAPDQ